MFCAFNTFFVLLSQEEQLKCFEGVSTILAGKGAFVLELFVPDLSRFERHQPALVGPFGENDLQIEVSHHETITQRVSSRILHVRDGEVLHFLFNV